jgi:NitT/TauT family transport system permease protein
LLIRRVLPPLAALVVFLLLWELATHALGIPAYVLPPPSAVAVAGASRSGALFSAALSTGRAALAGFALSAVLGVLAAVLLASSRVLERALYPYTVFLQTVPIVAIAPILVIWFGAGFRLYGAGRAATLLKLELPAAVPSIVTGLRVAGGLSVIGTIVGEFVAGYAEEGAGLGITVMEANRQFRTDLLFAAVLSASLLGLLIFGGVNLAGYLLLRRWHPSEKG